MVKQGWVSVADVILHEPEPIRRKWDVQSVCEFAL